MCYLIITSRSLIWFLLNLVMGMLIACSLAWPTWLLGPPVHVVADNFTLLRNPSVGIYTRCIVSPTSGNFHCGSFDLDWLATDSSIYPTEWKLAKIVLCTALFLASLTVSFCMLSCCRQSIFGKSIHTVTGCGQAVVGILVLIVLFLHPLAWGHPRVKRLCGPDADSFYVGECSIGSAMISAIAVVLLSFSCGFFSLKAESSNMHQRVRRRVENGEKFVCIP